MTPNLDLRGPAYGQDGPVLPPSVEQEARDAAAGVPGRAEAQRGSQPPRESHDNARQCRCVADHRPAPLELERHHIWPLYLGGPDEPWNVEWLCPTTHTNTHELLREMLRLRQDAALAYSWFTARYAQPVNRWAYHIAAVGHARWLTNRAGSNPKTIALSYRMLEGE